jgi:hypothetical protein
MRPTRSCRRTRHGMFWPWALLANENGHSGADGYELADGLVPTLETAGNVDVVPPNRTLEAMTLIGLDRITSCQEAMKLPGALDVSWMMRAPSDDTGAASALRGESAAQCTCRTPGIATASAWTCMSSFAPAWPVGGFFTPNSIGSGSGPAWPWDIRLRVCVCVSQATGLAIFAARNAKCLIFQADQIPNDRTRLSIAPSRLTMRKARNWFCLRTVNDICLPSRLVTSGKCLPRSLNSSKIPTTTLTGSMRRSSATRWEGRWVNRCSKYLLVDSLSTSRDLT